MDVLNGVNISIPAYDCSD